MPVQSKLSRNHGIAVAVPLAIAVALLRKRLLSRMSDNRKKRETRSRCSHTHSSRESTIDTGEKEMLTTPQLELAQRDLYKP